MNDIPKEKVKYGFLPYDYWRLARRTGTQSFILHLHPEHGRITDQKSIIVFIAGEGGVRMSHVDLSLSLSPMRERVPFGLAPYSASAQDEEKTELRTSTLRL